MTGVQEDHLNNLLGNHYHKYAFADYRLYAMKHCLINFKNLFPNDILQNHETLQLFLTMMMMICLLITFAATG